MSTDAPASWSDLLARVTEALATLRPGRFVLLEYHQSVTWDPCPYAQCAREVDGWYCEVVSEFYLPRGIWPIDELALLRSGWLVPDDTTDNWWCSVASAADAAELLILGLRSGRLCADPDSFSCTVGTFPSGPDGGEPLPIPYDSDLFLAA